MTTNNKKNKKNSAARKLIPAIGMLTVSAMMLSSSTYAWFTMSREVEVQNIQMTATVPEDMQLSLGALGTSNSKLGESESDGTLTAGSGLLLTSLTGKTAVGGVIEPQNTWDWSNTADITKYYQFGKLIPASSNTGENIFFTPDSAGVGRTLKDNAGFYQAAAKTAAYKWKDATDGFTAAGTGNVANATAHVVTAKSGDTVSDAWSTRGNTGTGAVNYTKSTAWDSGLNDDGYYVDIPIWIRTSATGSTTLKVSGWVAPKAIVATGSTELGTANDESLYKAVRVAILDSTGVPSQADGSIIDLKDGRDSGGKKMATSPYAGSSILDSKNYTVTRDTAAAVTDTDLFGVSAGAAGTWTKFTAYDPTKAICTLTGPTVADGVKSGEYGTPTQLYIRVWLEGEDEDCWNETAGQDWSINLKFEKLANTPVEGA